MVAHEKMCGDDDLSFGVWRGAGGLVSTISICLPIDPLNLNYLTKENRDVSVSP